MSDGAAKGTPQAGEPGTVAVTVADRGAAAQPTYSPRPSASTPKLRVSNLSVTYRDRSGRATEAVRDVSFDILNKPDVGEIVVFLGPSGCGKSTILKAVAGLLEPTEGEVLLDGQPVTGVGRERGMVFQAYTSFGWLTVRDNVEYGLRLQGVRKTERRERSDHYLKAVGLEEFADRYPKDLSGGMKQRVAIARTLINRPRLVLMDEPFGALDPQTRWGMQSLLLDVSRTEDNTILFVTHDVSEAVYLADAVYVLSNRPARILHRVDVPVLSRPRRGPEVCRRVPPRREAAARPALRATAALHVECDRMSAPEKPSPAGPQPQAAPGAAKPGRAMASAVRETARDLADSVLFDKRPYLKLAFRNPYNLSLFVGALAAAGITLNPVLAIAALGAEALWLLYAPDSTRLQHLLWDPKFERIRNALLEEQRAERMTTLAEEVRVRVQRLVDRQHEIRRLAAQNPSFTGDLLRSELVKTDKLVDAFIDLAVTCSRYEQYLVTVDVAAVERERGRWETTIRTGEGAGPGIDIAKRNLAILGKRLDKVGEIRRYLDVARGQLDLIENSFQLIGDQIVTMQSPQELSGQLNDLLDGVEAIEQSAARHRADAQLAGDHGVSDARVLPAWADDLRRRYLRGESAMFILHGNVYDTIVQQQAPDRSHGFSLLSVLLKDNKDAIARLQPLDGGPVSRKCPPRRPSGSTTCCWPRRRNRVLAALERLLVGSTRTAVILEYADTLAPAGDPSFQADGDRAAIVTLHRWSFLPEIERGDNVVLLVTENLAELSPKLVSNPKVAVVEVPMPDREARRAAAKLADPMLRRQRRGSLCGPDRRPEGRPDRRHPRAAARGGRGSRRARDVHCRHTRQHAGCRGARAQAGGPHNRPRPRRAAAAAGARARRRRIRARRRPIAHAARPTA